MLTLSPIVAIILGAIVDIAGIARGTIVAARRVPIHMIVTFAPWRKRLADLNRSTVCRWYNAYRRLFPGGNDPAQSTADLV